MGLAELKEQWEAGGAWTETLEGWTKERESQLPRLREIFDRLLTGESSAAEFRSEMDSFGKQTKYGGFHGLSGQMFLNLLVKAADDDDLVAALRDALPVPTGEADCRSKLTDFVAFVEATRERAKSKGETGPAPGSAPYFLSFFWESQDRAAWPIYYPNSRATLAAHDLFTETGPLPDRYLRYRELMLKLRQELDADTWGVESLLWHLTPAKVPEQEPAPKPDGGTGVVPTPAIAPGDLYESYRSEGLIFPDETITSLVLSLLTKPFVLLSGISGTGKTQIAIGLAEYLDRHAGTGIVQVAAPTGDDSNVYIRLTDARLRLKHTRVTREHQAVFALHGLPERGTSRDYPLTLPNGTAATIRLNNIGFTDPTRENYLLFFRDAAPWLNEHAQAGDYLHLGLNEEGEIDTFELVRPELRESEAPARRHEVIAVRSDWTDPRGLIGYENPLTGTYTRTDLITLLLRAQADPDKPYIVILDEMNLARVEYYFSDFLSAMELSAGTIALRESAVPGVIEDEGDNDNDVPARLPLPSNLLVVGTVNVDETTHAFSPKVLDRANVIVFNEIDAQRFIEGGGEAAASTFRLTTGKLDVRDFAHRQPAITAALANGKQALPFTEPLLDMHDLLQEHNLHFGYRVLREMTTFAGMALERVSGDEETIARTAFDLQIVQKVLPKLNGGRELELPLSQLLAFCLDGTRRKNVDTGPLLTEARKRLAIEPAQTAAGADQADESEAQSNDDDEDGADENAADTHDSADQAATATPAPATYPRAARELVRMLTRLRSTGFVAFLE